MKMARGPATNHLHLKAYRQAQRDGGDQGGVHARQLGCEGDDSVLVEVEEPELKELAEAVNGHQISLNPATR